MYVVVTFLDVLDNFSIAQGDVGQTHNLGSLNTHTHVIHRRANLTI